MANAVDVVNKLRERQNILEKRGRYSEADTVNNLIDPVLEYLGYDARYQSREIQDRQNRPDIVLWNELGGLDSKPANIILEAKPLDNDLSGNGVPRVNRPKSQLNRYLNGYPRSSAGTYGVLTNGNIWHLVQRREGEKKPRLVKEWRLLRDSEEEAAHGLEEISQIIGRLQTPSLSRSSARAHSKAREICNALAQCAQPEEILRLLTGSMEYRTELEGQVQLFGKAQEQESSYWETYAYAVAGRIKAEQADQTDESLCISVVKAVDAESSDDRELYREDVAIAGRAFATHVPLKMSVILMIQPDELGDYSSVRLAVHYQGHTGMTAEFNPHTPSPMTLKTIQSVYGYINRKTPTQAQRIADSVAARGVRKEFYQRVAAGWTLRQQRKATGNAKRRFRYRESVLRHLIRTIFAWILREEGKLPQDVFDEAFANREANGDYHNEILRFLYHERLNRRPDARSPHENSNIEKALASVRFLNGSLFAEHTGDDDLKIPDEDYFGPEGLFTILSEYEWTASEHTPQSSDQTIDPEVLSNLFENLLVVTKFGEETPDRMPAGTYYTPSDVALEMVKDALSEAVIDHAPPSMGRDRLRDLFGDEDSDAPEMTHMERSGMASRIRELTIFDPAVGSGEFPFLCALAIRTALKKLGDSARDTTRDIISRQLFAQDINPMAVQVTRLRMFIAIIASESDDDSEKPLPNLEGRIACADTLQTVADPNWSPFGTGHLQDVDDAVKFALAEVASIRKRWLDSHDEDVKTELRLLDKNARAKLKKAIGSGMSSPETANFANCALLEPDAPAAQTDPRLLFYNPQWHGFDIVIGNPPYEALSASIPMPPNPSREERREVNRQRKNRKREMLNDKRYQTTSGNDLYNLIAEAALALARPEGGVVTLVVPLSLCFGQDQSDTRKLFETRCSRINLRNQDIRPDKTFHDSPVAHPQNSQRTTIITAKTGKAAPTIEIGGTDKWLKSERHEFLISRRKNLKRTANVKIDPRVDSQWERIPTYEIQNLISAMKSEKTKIYSLMSDKENEHELGFPPTARYFITTAPAGKLDRGENTLPMIDRASLELALAAANSHAGYAWWKTYGDAFHINPHEIETVAIPSTWVESKDTNRKARALGRELIAAIIPDNITRIRTGTGGAVQDSLNFHEWAGETIAEIDKLYLEALGLNSKPLLQQLHTLRGTSTWRLGQDST